HGVCCPRYRGYQWTYALQAWFDKHLKGLDVDTGPPVEVFLTEGTFGEAVQGQRRDEIFTTERFPGAHRMLELFPDSDGTLSQSSPTTSGQVSFAGDPGGFTNPTGTGGISFRTEPITDDLVLLGFPELDLVASVTAPRVHLIANLYDENENGILRRISQFAINPELRAGLATPKPVVPGERYVLEPPGFAMAHHLKVGHRLTLRVTTSDPDKVPIFAIDPNVTVFTGPDGTAVRVPVVENAVLYQDRFPLEDPLKRNLPKTPPVGEAQQGVRETVTVPAPGAGNREEGVTSVFLEFDIVAGKDNARMQVVGVPSQSADIELYLQRRDKSGAWGEDLEAGTGGGFDREGFTTERLSPGHYRIEVHDFLGPPATSVELTITFLNGDGRPGPEPV
ncbi:MAG: CocE/NonD family hydrolase C-terminal non-catalytic domain-containing protein, partial [Candidatus Methylomirabilales bacterium]